jgi:hypothetical protein
MRACDYRDSLAFVAPLVKRFLSLQTYGGEAYCGVNVPLKSSWRLKTVVLLLIIVQRGVESSKHDLCHVSHPANPALVPSNQCTTWGRGQRRRPLFCNMTNHSCMCRLIHRNSIFLQWTHAMAHHLQIIVENDASLLFTTMPPHGCA